MVGLAKPVILVSSWAEPDPRGSVGCNLIAMRNPPGVPNRHGNVVPLLCVPVMFRSECVSNFVQHRLFALVKRPQLAKVLRHRNRLRAVITQAAALFRVVEPERPRVFCATQMIRH